MCGLTRVGRALIALVGFVACCAEGALIYGVTRPEVGDSGTPKISSAQWVFALVLVILLVMTACLTMKNAQRRSE